MKIKSHCRISFLPQDDDIIIKYPSSKDINKLVCFNGTVTKTFDSQMIESVQTYSCAKCGFEFSVRIDYGFQDLLVKPPKCPNENDCNSDKFKIVEKSKI